MRSTRHIDLAGGSLTNLETAHRPGAEGAYRRADQRGDADGAFNLAMLLVAQDRVAEAETAFRRAERRGHADAALSLRALLEQPRAVDAAQSAPPEAAEDANSEFAGSSPAEAVVPAERVEQPRDHRRKPLRRLRFTVLPRRLSLRGSIAILLFGLVFTAGSELAKHKPDADRSAVTPAGAGSVSIAGARPSGSVSAPARKNSLNGTAARKPAHAKASPSVAPRLASRRCPQAIRGRGPACSLDANQFPQQRSYETAPTYLKSGSPR